MFLTRPELQGTVGMVSSTHWLASAAGMAALEAGGNAFDAAVTAGFTLQVVEPHLNGPGGDLPLIFAGPDRQRRNPAFVLAPQIPLPRPMDGPDGTDWTDARVTAATVELVDAFVSREPVDTDRIYLVGLSSGGRGIYHLLSKYPGRFAAAMPTCGWGETSAMDRITERAVWWLAKGSKPAQAHEDANAVETRKTRAVNIPVVANGAVRGYAVAQFNYTIDAAVLKKLPAPPDAYLLDEAFRLLYAEEKLDTAKLDKVDLARLTREIAARVNARLKGEVVKDVLVGDFNYVGIEDVRR